MSIYLQQFIIAAVVVYIVDLSGFTDSWRALLARLLHIDRLRPLPPFDCSTCAVWWSCIIAAAVAGQFTILPVAFAALLSYLSTTISGLLLFIREWLLWLLNKMMPR